MTNDETDASVQAHGHLVQSELGNSISHHSHTDGLKEHDHEPSVQTGETWQDGMPFEEQTKRLADFITENYPGEPSQSGGAIETAIRLMKRNLNARSDRDTRQWCDEAERQAGPCRHGLYVSHGWFGQRDRDTGETWQAVPMANPGWSALVVPEAEGFDLVMPTWVADRILADHELAAWSVEARKVIEQAKVDFRLIQTDSEREKDQEYILQDVFNDAVFALNRLDNLARYPQQEEGN